MQNEPKRYNEFEYVDSRCVDQIFNKHAIQVVYTYINRNMFFFYISMVRCSPIVGRISSDRFERTVNVIHATGYNNTAIFRMLLDNFCVILYYFPRFFPHFCASAVLFIQSPLSLLSWYCPMLFSLPWNCIRETTTTKSAKYC